MNFTDFQHFFSNHRINRYIIACGGDQKRAIRLYKANLKVSQSFHPLLGVLEVVLRNSLNNVLTGHFSDSDWIINQKTGFMIDPSLTYINRRSGRPLTNDYLLKQVTEAERRLTRSGTAITSGKIIAEQTFAFWTELFERYHYRLLLGTPIRIFNHLPSGKGRSDVIRELTVIRRFRNRINHNEPICFNSSNIDFSTTINVHTSYPSDQLHFIVDKDKKQKDFKEGVRGFC